MTKKNSITAFKRKGDGILPTSDEPEYRDEGVVPKRSSKPGPKPKPKKEKQTHRVMLSLTQFEADVLARKKGLANEATVIRAFLIDKGFFN